MRWVVGNGADPNRRWSPWQDPPRWAAPARTAATSTRSSRPPRPIATGSNSNALGAFSLTLLGVASVVGAGIFVVTGDAAAHYAGPAVLISFVLAGIVAGLTALCYAELASMIPAAGSTYSYAFAAFGSFVGWFIGWDLLLEYLFAASTVAVGWSGYFVSLCDSFGIHLPHALVNRARSATTPGSSTCRRWRSCSSPRARSGSAPASRRSPTTRW